MTKNVVVDSVKSLGIKIIFFAAGISLRLILLSVGDWPGPLDKTCGKKT